MPVSAYDQKIDIFIGNKAGKCFGGLSAIAKALCRGNDAVPCKGSSQLGPREFPGVPKFLAWVNPSQENLFGCHE
jgi:hypothetical protein